MQNFFWETLYSLDDFSPGGLLHSAFLISGLLFTGWMFLAAMLRGEYLWAGFIFFFSIISALLFFFMVYRPSGGGVANPFSGWQWPGAGDRHRIAELQSQIHFLDRSHLYLQLGDIYLRQNRLGLAEQNYRAAYERAPSDEDACGRLGVTLARRNRAADALPLLCAVTARNPRHDYGETLMTQAETQAKLGQAELAAEAWRGVLAHYSYPRARLQYAKVLVSQEKPEEARRLLQEIVHDLPFTARFERKRAAPWIAQARSLLRTLPHA